MELFQACLVLQMVQMQCCIQANSNSVLVSDQHIQMQTKHITVRMPNAIGAYFIEPIPALRSLIRFFVSLIKRRLAPTVNT